MRILVCAVVLTLVAFNSTIVEAQSDLDELHVRIAHVMESNFPGWKHKRVEPIEGSKNVLEVFWSLSNRVVKVSVIVYKSGQEAREAIEDFAQHETSKEEIRGLGDEAYAWGYRRSNVAFRRGRFVVYVSTTVDVDEDADARNLSAIQKNERMTSEMRRWSREFANQAVGALNSQ